MEKLELNDYLDRIATALEESNEIQRDWINWQKKLIQDNAEREQKRYERGSSHAKEWAE